MEINWFIGKKKFKKKQYDALWVANGLYPEGARQDKLAHFVADGLLYGVLEPCPGCGKTSLTYRSGIILCEGWMSGFSECIFRGKPEDYKRYAFDIPPTMMREFAWLDDWFEESGLVPYERDWSKACSADPDAAAYGDTDPDLLKMDELRAELKKRGISSAGKKGALIGRLKKALKKAAAEKNTVQEEEKKTEEKGTGKEEKKDEEKKRRYKFQWA